MSNATPRLTARQAAIVSAYTGFMAGPFKDLHAFAAELLGRPIFLHEFADEKMVKLLNEKSKPYFEEICHKTEV